jgi:hypothetical protein
METLLRYEMGLGAINEGAIAIGRQISSQE